MNEALTYMYYIFDRYVDFIFNGMQIVSGVTVGWVLVVIILFAMMIRSILNMPRSMGSFDRFRQHSYDRIVFSDNKAYHTRVYSRRR